MFRKDPGYFRTAGTLESQTPDSPGLSRTPPFLANVIASLFASFLYTAILSERASSLGPAIPNPMASSQSLWALQNPNTKPDKLLIESQIECQIDKMPDECQNNIK